MAHWKHWGIGGNVALPEGERVSARAAARRYAEDDAFASEFDRTLQEIYSQHIASLARIKQRLGASSIAATGELPDAKVSPAPFVTPERVEEVVRAAEPAGLTRGDIATRLGIDSRDARFARVLRALKANQKLRQTGSRRAARYFTAPAAKVRGPR